MRKIIYWVHVSLDGRIEGPNGEFDWAAMSPELSAYSFELTGRVDTFLYGRRVWDMMASYWPDVESISTHEHDLAFAPIWRSRPKVVFSTTLRHADWNTRVIGADLAGAVAALKREPGGDMLLNGGAEVGAALTRSGLIDEIQLVVHPVLLGGGKEVFPGLDARANLRLVESRTFDGRTVLLRHVPAG